VRNCFTTLIFDVQGGEPWGSRPLLGSLLRPGDRAGAQRVALINQPTAERHFPNQNPIGKRIAYGAKPIDVTQRTVSLVLRTTVEPEFLSQAVRRELAELDRDAAVFPVKTMEQVVYDSTTGTRLLSRLLTIFSALALVLALVGVYGVMSCLVTQRTHEFGVRMALGAGRGAILRLVLGDGLRQGLKGALPGISCAVGASQPLGQFVIGMSPLHVATCAAAALVLAIALAASLVAAHRASRADPWPPCATSSCTELPA